MNTTMTQKAFPIGFNIHLISFQLPKNVIKENEDIRVSITTLPEESKQHFHLHGKKMLCTNHVFSLNVTNKTKKVIMVFRKKIFLHEDPIIASTIIYQEDFPKLPDDVDPSNIETMSTDVKTLNIYYPLQKQIQEEKAAGKYDKTKKIDRKILGQMQIQLSFTSPYTSLKHKHQKNNNSKNSGFEKTHRIPKEPRDSANNSPLGIKKANKGKKAGRKGNYEVINSQSQFESIFVNNNENLM